MAQMVDIDLMREALSSSTLSHGLKLMGDRWTLQVLLGAFLGLRKFDEWHTHLGIPRHTLADRIKTLVQVDVFRPRLYQERPERYGYHFTPKGLALYDTALMTWLWEVQYGEPNQSLPRRLVHQTCGHSLIPEMACSACGDTVLISDLSFRLKPNPRLPHDTSSLFRSVRMSASSPLGLNVGLWSERWCLMIVAAVLLGCHYFDQISAVLRISPNVLTQRLKHMVNSGWLQCEQDRGDARRRIYRLTPSSRALFGYIACLTHWAGSQHFHEHSSILPIHGSCGQPFVARVQCSHCHQPPQPWDVVVEFSKEKSA